MADSAASTGSLVLIGGGGAHLSVLEALAQGRFRPARVTLVTPDPIQLHDAMVPGLIAGRYSAKEIGIDVAALAREAHAELVTAAVASLDPARRTIVFVDGSSLKFDVASLSSRGEVPRVSTPGRTESHPPARAVDRAIALLKTLDVVSAGGRGEIVVSGGGSHALEIALATRARCGGSARVTVVDDAALLAQWPPAARRCAFDSLRRHRIGVIEGDRVARVGDGELALASGATIRCGLLLQPRGEGAPGFVRAAGLAVDEAGLVTVDELLRSTASPNVFASGDLARPHDESPLAAGELGRAESPVLVANLAAVLTGRTPSRRWKRRQSMTLLDTGDGSAVFAYGSVATSGRWALRLRERLDRKFVARFNGVRRRRP